MRRKQATALIDELRTMAAANKHAGNESVPLWRLEELLQKHGLKPLERCEGEAHSNAYIDNCHTCAPRWGWVGPVEVVS